MNKDVIEEGISFTSDVEREVPVPPNKVYSKILWIGVMIGAGIFLSIGGILQHFMQNSLELQAILKDTWFKAPLWLWIPSLTFFVLLFGYIRVKINK